MKRISKLLHLVLVGLALSFSASASAEGHGPQIPKAVKGEECVEPTDVMRRDHMKFLMHQRDDTLREGIRGAKHSLKDCLNCHVPDAEQAKAEGSEGEHFCMSCHSYAGVKVDCFECHATRPQKSAMFHPLVTPAMSNSAHQIDGAALLNTLAAGNNDTETPQ